MADRASVDLTAIREEADRMEESCKWSAQNQFEQAKIWRRQNQILTIPSAALAAIAGAAGLAIATSRVAVAIVALVASAFAAVSATLNLARRVEQAQASAAAYLSLQTDFRVLQRIDLATFSYDEARAQLSELIARQQELNGTAPIPSSRAYDRARRNIECGGQDYEIDLATIGRTRRRSTRG